jgi:hypothetical protein
MDLRLKIAAGLLLAFLGARDARADFIELTEQGAARLASLDVRDCIQMHVDSKQGSRFGFLRGMILNQHDQLGNLSFDTAFDMATNLGADALVKLNGSPEKFFLFLPYQWITRSTTGRPEWPRTYLLEWKDVSSVRHEIDTLDDLDALVSWRCQAPRGSSPDAVTDQLRSGLSLFLHQLDPDNAWTLGGGGVGAPANLHEGSITRYLLHDRMSGPERVKRMQECRKGLGPIGNYGASWTSMGVKYSPTDPDWADTTAEATMTSLLEGMSRCRKAPGVPGAGVSTQPLYNIPNADLIRENAKIVAQFMSADLANVRPSAARADPNARRVLEYALRARKTVLATIMAASPDNVHRLTSPGAHPPTVLLRPGEPLSEAQLRVTNVDDELPANVFDLADAALEVVVSFSKTGSTGVRTPTDEREIVDTLLAVAAGLPAFNGNLPVRGDQVTVGNEALGTLTALAGDPVTGANFRTQLVNRVANATNVTVRAAATEVLKRADLMNANTTRLDVEDSVQVLFDVALSPPTPEAQSYYSPPARGDSPSITDSRTIDATYLLRQIAKSGNSRAAASVSARVDMLRKKVADKIETSTEKSFLALYDAK